MTKKVVVLQEDKNDCAAACVSSLIKYYNGSLDMETIRNIINTTKHGTNAYDLINGCKEIGFDGFGKKLSFEELVSYYKFPLIAHIKKDNYYHFVVIYDINKSKEKITVMDPSIGLRKISFKEFVISYQGVIISLVKVKELPKEIETNHLFKVMISSIFINKKILIILMILSLILFILSLASSLFYKIILDDMSFVNKYYLSFAIILLIKLIFDYLRSYFVIKLNKEIELNMNKEITKRLLCLPYTYYKNKTTGEITSRINDLDLLKDLILEILSNILVNILLLLGSYIIIFYLNKTLALFILIPLLIYFIITILVNNLYTSKIRYLQELKGIYNNKLIETINGIETINNLNIKDNQVKTLNTYFEKTINSTSKFNLINTTLNIISEYLINISSIFVLLLGISLVKNNYITIGELFLIYILFGYFMNIVKTFLEKVPSLNYAYKNINKINSILKYTNEKKSNEKTSGKIILKEVQYKRGEYLFKNFNYSIDEKDKILLKGTSGSGKSTLLKMLLKNITNYEGNIYIGESNLLNIDKSIINNSFTYVGQNEFIFSGTIKDNIILSRNITNEAYNSILNITRVNEIIDKKELRDASYIEENGFNLSGGEKQRIILARGLLKNSNYILIDEALSEVDLVLEKDIIKDILKYFKDKTIVYVSHKEGLDELFNKKLIIGKE